MNPALDHGDRIGPVRHASARLWCAERGHLAVVNIIERDDVLPAARFVLWCSLRGCEPCPERCLEDALRP